MAENTEQLILEAFQRARLGGTEPVEGTPRASESLVETTFHLLENEIRERPAVGNILTQYFDYSEHGGAPLLGARVPSFVCHGKSTSKAIKNAIRVAGEFCRNRVNERIDKKISRMVS